ncbi:hypothetical protein GCM10007967_34470 [Xylanimonas ulmi]|uniref:Calcineurin-like phosphoesterase family protein n=1 Tax=Xylanimonas ulmi TaxID=228973 RepID=A0A4V2EXP8_9MICO|nr:calcineurin-like phosphoesterase family protein [Xylanibacterium ulmi]
MRWTLACAVALVACVAFGVLTASANLSLGPHEARYEVTTSGEITADLGPLGTLRLDSPAGPLGVDVIIREIPADLTEISQARTLEGLSGDLDSYLQFFGSPQVTINAVARALVVDAARRTGVAIVVVALVGAGLWFLVGRARRRELTSALAPRTWEITAGVAVLGIVAAMLVSDDVDTPANQPPMSPVFAGTALEGARLTGRLAGVIDTYGAQLVGIYRDNEEFYAQARTALQVAWDEQATVDRRIAAAAASQGTAGVLAPTPAGSLDAEPPDGQEPPEAPEPAQSPETTPPAEPSATAAPSARASATPSDASDESDGDDESAAADDRLVTFLVVSDLHCNMNMTPLIRDIAERGEVDAILDAGDTTMNGTAVEKVCVDTFATARPPGVPMVVSDGNHDSEIIAAAQKSNGITVLDGGVVDVAGVRILGDRDPNETRVGAGTSSRGETMSEAAQRLTQTACDAGDVDLLLVHTPAVGNQALDSGCVPLQVSGHTHLRHDPEVRGLGVRYINGSTAGAKSGQPTVGPLHGTAEMTLLRFDLDERRFVAWKLVEVMPDKTASVSPWRALPLRPSPPAADEDTDEDTGEDAGQDAGQDADGGGEGHAEGSPEQGATQDAPPATAGESAGDQTEHP